MGRKVGRKEEIECGKRKVFGSVCLCEDVFLLVGSWEGVMLMMLMMMIKSWGRCVGYREKGEEDVFEGSGFDIYRLGMLLSNLVFCFLKIKQKRIN